jgi:hypothetical protein
MKPLKEIGNLIKPDPRSLTQFEPYLAMSLEDRRELVRAVWDAARTPCPCEDVLCDHPSMSFDEYLEKEDL